MKERPVLLTPEAADDLNALYDWVEGRASPQVALRYLERVEGFILRLGDGSERGHLRADVRPGLRIIGFERRLTIAFTVEDKAVTVLRVFAGGRSWESSF